MTPGLMVRLVFGPILGGAVLGALWLDWATHTAYAFGLVTAGCGVLATIECTDLFRRCGSRPWFRFALVGAVGAVLAEMLQASPARLVPALPVGAMGFLGAWFVLLCVSWLRWGRGPEDAADLGATLFTAAYIGGLASCLLAIRGLRFGIAPGEAADPGLRALLWYACTTKSADIFAYFAGKSLGRHKLAPEISPKKTVEGAIGGLLGSVAVGFALWGVAGPAGAAMSAWQVAAFGASCSVACQLGDLVESRFKRRAGVKDSAHYLPEFGGMMDMTDGLVFAAPVGLAWLRAVGG